MYLKMVAIPKEFYTNARYFISHNGKITDAFEMRQGLYIIVIDDIIYTNMGMGTEENDSIQWRQYKRLSHQDYVDGLCFLA